MPKVFAAMLISCELIGPKVRPIGVADGLQVKIPVFVYIWQALSEIYFVEGAIKGGQSGKNRARNKLSVKVWTGESNKLVEAGKSASTS